MGDKSSPPPSYVQDARGKTREEDLSEAPLPRTAPSDEKLFNEIFYEKSEEKRDWHLDKGRFQSALSAASSVDGDTISFVQDVGKSFAVIVEDLVRVAGDRPDNASAAAAYLLEDGANEIKSAAQWLLDIDMEDLGLKGELLFYVADLVFAAYDVTRVLSREHGATLIEEKAREQLREQRSQLGSAGAKARGISRANVVTGRESFLLPIAKRIIADRSPEKLSIEDLAFEVGAATRESGWGEIKPVKMSTICSDLRRMDRAKKLGRQRRRKKSCPS